MHQLPEPVLSQFKRDHFVVKRSAHKFSQIDPDQAMEWINGTGKKGGGIIGITKTTSALCRWTLSFNLRSHIAELTHEMYSIYRGSTDLHNEATKSRQKRDNDDESSLMSTFLGFNVFLSVSHPATLQNLVTQDLATEVIQESLLHAKVWTAEVKKFVQDRLIVAEQCDKPDVSIYEPVRNTPTFATLYEVVNKHTKDRDQKTVMKADRNVLRRLITSYDEGRSVDLSSVLKHELLPVPVSLAEMNGTLRTGNKSELANVVTEDIDCPETIQLHAKSSFLIIDGQALVVDLGMPDAAVTFGDLADTLLKGTTRTRRSKTARPIRWIVEGRDVHLLKNWSNFLSLADNKADLAHFLSEEMCSQTPVDK